MSIEYWKNVDEILDLLRFMGAWLLPFGEIGIFLIFVVRDTLLVVCGSVQ